MAPSRHDLIAAMIHAQEQVAQSMLALAEPEWLALELTLTQLKTLMVLFKSDGIPMHQLAGVLGLGRPATSTLVDQLVRQQLLARREDPADRRRTLVNLTPEGKAFITRLRQGREEKMLVLLSALTDDDLITFVRLLQTLARAAQTLP